MEGEITQEAVQLVVMVNAAAVGIGLVGVGAFLGKAKLTAGVPEGRQNFGEFVLDFFVGKAREMGHAENEERVVRAVAPLLATFFLFIFVSNLVGVIPIPRLNMPPTAYFSTTLALALLSVLGTVVLSARLAGAGNALKHLVWPNPLEFVSKVTDVFSLSLRLFGNIGGEYMTLVLVAGAVAVGIPLVLHVLGFIPAFVQALVFTLLTASFMAGAIHHEERAAGRKRKKRTRSKKVEAVSPLSEEGGS